MCLTVMRKILPETPEMSPGHETTNISNESNKTDRAFPLNCQHYIFIVLGRFYRVNNVGLVEGTLNVHFRGTLEKY